MNQVQRREWRRLYRRVRRHPVGRWAVWLVWIGLGLCSFGCAFYLPIALERREVLLAAGCVGVAAPMSEKVAAWLLAALRRRLTRRVARALPHGVTAC